MASWSAVVGAVRTDKLGFARQLVQCLEQLGIEVGGFVQPDAGDGGWDLENLSNGERRSLARRSSDPTICDIAFDPTAFDTAARWATESHPDVLVVHSVGKLEAAERGHWPLLSALLAEPAAPHLVLCIRDNCLATIALRLEDPIAHIELPAGTQRVSEFAREVARAVAR
jgi:nucleoside-triphosphatase THEP1